MMTDHDDLPFEGTDNLGRLAKIGDARHREAVEVAPPYDHNEITSLLAARAILDVLATLVASGKIGRRAS
jgi:arginase family enzyme